MCNLFYSKSNESLVRILYEVNTRSFLFTFLLFASHLKGKFFIECSTVMLGAKLFHYFSIHYEVMLLAFDPKSLVLHLIGI